MSLTAVLRLDATIVNLYEVKASPFRAKSLVSKHSVVGSTTTKVQYLGSESPTLKLEGVLKGSNAKSIVDTISSFISTDEAVEVKVYYNQQEWISGRFVVEEFDYTFEPGKPNAYVSYTITLRRYDSPMFKAGWLELLSLQDSLLNIIEQLVSDNIKADEALDFIRELLKQDSAIVQDFLNLINEQLLSDQVGISDSSDYTWEQLASDSINISDLLEKLQRELILAEAIGSQDSCNTYLFGALILHCVATDRLTGQAIQGVKLTLDPNTSDEVVKYTDVSGVADFNINAGTHTLRAEYEGYKAEEETFMVSA